MSVVRSVIKNEAGQEVTVYIEVDEQQRTVKDTKELLPGDFDPYEETRGISQQITTAFDGAMELIRTCAERTGRTIQAMTPDIRPRACEVQFGVKIDAELGAFIGKTSAEAQIVVTLTWGEEKGVTRKDQEA